MRCTYTNVEEKCQISAAVSQCKMMQKNYTYWEDYWYLERKLSVLIQNSDSLNLRNAVELEKV